MRRPTPMLVSVTFAALLGSALAAGGATRADVLASRVDRYHARGDTVLAWDVGYYSSISHYFTGQEGDGLAVIFQAPEWADYITRVQFFIMNDNYTDPDDPWGATVLPFLCSVWSPAGGDPSPPQGPPVIARQCEGPFCEDCWYDFKLMPPVRITDGAAFPDRTFLVGLEWLHNDNPRIALDYSSPDSRSYMAVPPPWQQVTSADIMIRAVVVDDPSSTILHVPTDVPTIQEALDLVAERDTIYVAPGVYTGLGNRDLDPHGKRMYLLSESGSSETIIDCERQGRAFYIHSREDWSTLIQGFTVINGLATGGGGLLCQDSRPRFVDCRFSGNEATSHGGAVSASNYTTSGGPYFYSCSFVENTAGSFGGGVHADVSDPRFVSCTFANNAAPTGGGVCLYAGCEPTLERTIIASSSDGVGLYCGGNSSPTLLCCDVFGNAGGDWVGCLDGLLGLDGNFSADPLFCMAGSPLEPYSLHEGSPCLPDSSPCGELIGALGQGCGPYSTVIPTTWGGVKALFR